MPGVTIVSGASSPSATTLRVMRDGQLRRHRHDRVEVPCAVAIGQVAPAIRLPCLDQCDIARQRIFQQTQPAADLARLAAFREQRVGAGGRVEAGDARAGRADAFGQRALRHDLHLQVATLEQPAGEARRAHEAADQPAHAAERQQSLDRAAIASAGDSHDGQIARALRDQAVEQRCGNADIAEASEQDSRAIGNASHGIGHGMHELVDHGASVAHGSGIVEATDTAGVSLCDPARYFDCSIGHEEPLMTEGKDMPSKCSQRRRRRQRRIPQQFAAPYLPALPARPSKSSTSSSTDSSPSPSAARSFRRPIRQPRCSPASRPLRSVSCFVRSGRSSSATTATVSDDARRWW